MNGHDIYVYSLRSFSDTFAKLGILLSVYFSVPILLSCLQADDTTQALNRLVRDQVYRFDDPQLDLDLAYCLFTRQNERCKYCLAYLTLERQPVLHRSVKKHSFLRMKTTEVKYDWCCTRCSSEFGRNIELERKMAEMIDEEFDPGDSTSCEIAID